ncbi:Uncharacterised protein [uncultured archaeon]|nr:Uncharacterised protein [uncultured archaeon]
MKKGLSNLGKILTCIIVILIIAILFNFFRYYTEAREIKKPVEKNATVGQDFNYYLPADFAAIKLKRGFFEANVTGIIVSFEDNSTSYDYESTDYPLSQETKKYIIQKDQLSPKVPTDWDFSKVRFVSLKYRLGDSKSSRVVSRIEVSPEKISPDFGERCFSVSEEGQEKISCG